MKSKKIIEKLKRSSDCCEINLLTNLPSKKKTNKGKRQ